jgi:hypothetical protein
LYVGETWSENWTESCTNGYVSSSALRNGLVADVESVTVPAGTFDTVRVSSTITEIMGIGSGSNPPTRVITDTEWLDVNTGKQVKVTDAYSYSGAVPSVGYPVQSTSELQSFQ